MGTNKGVPDSLANALDELLSALDAFPEGSGVHHITIERPTPPKDSQASEIERLQSLLRMERNQRHMDKMAKEAQDKEIQDLRNLLKQERERCQRLTAEKTAAQNRAEKLQDNYNTLLRGNDTRMTSMRQKNETINRLQAENAELKRHYNDMAEAFKSHMSGDRCASMTTPIGILPINSRGMRQLADAYAHLASRYNELCAAHKDCDSLRTENENYDALFRAVVETLKEFDPKAGGFTKH